MCSHIWIEVGFGPKCVVPKDLQLHPASCCLHYAVQTFQDLIINTRADGKVVLFRPDVCIDQLYDSAVRATLPTFDKAELQICLQYLICSDWTYTKCIGTSDQPETSLLARVSILGTEQPLGLAVSSN
mgnify:CR=1 FL=1